MRNPEIEHKTLVLTQPLGSSIPFSAMARMVAKLLPMSAMDKYSTRRKGNVLRRAKSIHDTTMNKDPINDNVDEINATVFIIFLSPMSKRREKTVVSQSEVMPPTVAFEAACFFSTTFISVAVMTKAITKATIIIKNKMDRIAIWLPNPPPSAGEHIKFKIPEDRFLSAALRLPVIVLFISVNTRSRSTGDRSLASLLVDPSKANSVKVAGALNGGIRLSPFVYKLVATMIVIFIYIYIYIIYIYC